MNKVMFFYEDYRPVPEPDFETCTHDDFWGLIYSADYIFIDGKEGLENFKSIIKKFVHDLNDSLYSINEPGIYGYFVNGENDKWTKILSVIRELEVMRCEIQTAYIKNSRLPLEGEED